MAVDHGKALNDIEFLKKRFGGILDLADDVKETRRVISERASIKSEISNLLVEKTDLEEVIKKNEIKVRDLYKEAEVAGTKRDSRVKDADGKITALEKEAREIEVGINKRKADAQEDAKVIVSQAQNSAKAIMREAQLQVTEANKEYQRLTKAIEDLKARF